MVSPFFILFILDHIYMQLKELNIICDGKI